MDTVTIKGTHHRLADFPMRGSGGEGFVVEVDPATALKIWYWPTHPNFEGSSAEKKRERAEAVKRIELYGKKLQQFPKELPERLVAPIDLAYDEVGKEIVGYTMRLIGKADPIRNLGKKQFRTQAGITPNQALTVYRDLYHTVQKVHEKGVVIGDFNEMNVLVTGDNAWIIDGDAVQFGPFLSNAFTEEYVDPLLCDPGKDSPYLVSPYRTDSDWYAFAVMLIQGLLFVPPYQGTYNPKNPLDLIKDSARPLKGISIFHPEVQYPVKGIPKDRLPDDLLHHFAQVFTNKLRGTFPQTLLANLNWSKCLVCGVEHARSQCPNCATKRPQAIITSVVRGKVSVERVFESSGAIILAAVQSGSLRHVSYSGGKIHRESGTPILETQPNRDLRFRIRGVDTVIGLGDQIVFPNSGDAELEKHQVDTFLGNQPVFDANSSHVFWLKDGFLMRNDLHGPVTIGRLLRNRTRVWVGSKFGLGLSVANTLRVSVFNAQGGTGIIDVDQFPAVRGELVDAVTYFSDQRAWLFCSTREQGVIRNRCFSITSKGKLMAAAECIDGDGSWLGEITAKAPITLPGKSGGESIHALLSATDKGLVRIQEDTGQFTQVATFPDTAGLVDPSETLILGRDGLFLVSRNEIRKLTLRS